MKVWAWHNSANEWSGNFIAEPLSGFSIVETFYAQAIASILRGMNPPSRFRGI